MTICFSKIKKVTIILIVGVGCAGLLWVDPFGFFTVKASGFSLTRWDAVAVGASQAEVLASLGEPYRRVQMAWNSDYPEVWYYSRKRTVNVLFRDYRIYFDTRHVVVRKTVHSEF